MQLKSRKFLVAVVIVSSLLCTVTGALACWQTMLQECFELPENQWPWFNPAGSGRRWTNCVIVNGATICWPNIPNQYLRWGVQDDFFNNSICPPEHDTQSCWVIGQPRSQDPEFDDYPPNLDTYMVFGPFDLRNRTAAHVTFFLLNQSELDHDSVYWGASNSILLTPTNMQVGGSFSGRPEPQEYMIREFDLTNLRNYTTHDSVSMLDSAAVWVFWRFKADNNANTSDYGTFVDEVVVRLDDGCYDLLASSLELFRANGRLLVNDPSIGDTLYAVLDLTTCDGAVDATYPAFQVMGVIGNDTIINERIQGADRNQRFIFTSEQWIVDAYGDFTVRCKVDTLDEVTECIETNNSENESYHLEPPNEPPQFTWLAPGVDTLFIATSDYLRWSCTDPGEVASINLYYDLDPLGCEGISIPGALFLPENDGPDSLLWDLTNDSEGRVYYVFAQVTDAANTVCTYASLPVVKRGLAAGDRQSLLPREMYLSQNYPNPFNPTTEIRYGIAKGGAVDLTVFDLLGREVATLVNRDLVPGHYTAIFSGSSLGSGIYFYTLTAPEGTRTGKMMLLR